MADIEERLRIAMLSATDGAEASPEELIKMVVQRHQRRTRLTGSVMLVILTIVVSTAIVLLSVLNQGRSPSSRVMRPTKLPVRLSGLPMPAGTQFELLLSTSRGLGWYSTATRRTEPIAGLPPLASGYHLARLYGGWAAWSASYSSPCSFTKCAGPPTTFYFIADGSLTATRIGMGYAGDGVDPGASAGNVWLVTYPHITTKLTASSFAQLVGTAGQPLGRRYRLPANYLMGRGVGSYLLLDLNTNQSQFELWDPMTGRVLGRFDNVVAQGPAQIVWSSGCPGCKVHVTNASTGKTITTAIPGSQPASLNATLSDDGRLLAVQLPNRELAVVNTATGSMSRIAGTALSAADFEYFDWQHGGHRLVIISGPKSAPGPDQIAYWQPGDTHVYVALVRNRREISAIETGAAG